MTQAAEYVPFSDPRRLFLDGPVAKQAHREWLARIFAPQPELEPESSLDELADAVADRVVSKLLET